MSEEVHARDKHVLISIVFHCLREFVGVLGASRLGVLKPMQWTMHAFALLLLWLHCRCQG